MSVSSTEAKAGPYSCNSSQTVFPFTFRVFTAADVHVILTDNTGFEAELTQGADYSVTLNADQNNNPGGDVTTVATYATGNKITPYREIAATQSVSFSTYRPDVEERSFDKLTMLVQQAFEQLSRAVKTTISGATGPDALIAAINAAASSAQASASAADVSEANALASATDAQAAVGALFYKADTQSVAFTKTGAGTASIKAGTKVAVASTLQTFATDTAVTMPTLTAGTDYAIYACTDGVVIADASFTAPSGYTVGNSRQIGGFHYAPGGNAAAQAGGDTTPAINEYSLWDLKFRPACTDPRGMALVAGSFWADIYLLGVDYLTNGSSKYNVSIADGSAPPKRSTLYGGNGTTTYADGNWWNLAEALRHCGKRHPTYSEFAAFAYGTTEATSSGGTDVPTTGVTGTGATNAWNKFTSKFGVIQASGCLWIWGDEFGGGAAAAAYTANTQGRGSTYQMETAVLLGGSWGGAADSGSRASAWLHSAAISSAVFGARGVSDHLCIT